MNPIRLFFRMALFAMLASTVVAVSQLPVTNLDAALTKAKKDKTLLFVLYGRATCGNCQALRSYLKTGHVRLASDKFVYVDLNCDDPAAQQEFGKHFKVTGNMLPFVVIADADGKQIDSRTGFGDETAFEKFIKAAAKKAAK